MSALPRAHQMEQVFGSLAAGKTVASSQSLELEPPWRVVGRDGSTSSVTGRSQGHNQNCPDCLAGRCGHNPQGCHCSDQGAPVTISLNRLDEAGSPERISAPGGGSATTAAMPQAKPQLFAKPPKQPPPPSFRQPQPREREAFLISTLKSNTDSERVSVPPPRVVATSGREQPSAVASTPQVSGDELQTVINHWPWLARSTRRAILAIIRVSSEADRA